MTTVLLVVNGGRPAAADLARRATTWLEERGHTVQVPKEDAEATGLQRLAAGPGLGEGADLAVALGGDGTILRAVHLAAPHLVPVLGANLGRLAYLSAVEPEMLTAALARFLVGDHGVEERTMVRATSLALPEGSRSHLGLNEVVIEKATPGHTVHLAVSIGGRFFASQVADALIVATPTGSTAYSFSAGGPIVSPHHQALLLTPVAPHTPFTHSLVLHPDEAVRVEVLDQRGAVLTVDGREVGRLGPGEAVTCEVAPVRARLVTLGERDFYGVLKAKFGLADR
ncbi:MAG: NAD(+)/NADH kinase [Actinomycetota bacterium]